ncbi:hypothetical protein AWC38_SpisGene10053 [Stylophora pistillata]|uniref:Crt-like 1 n=1 Tax=Stylophora pistillata TaxID=50429 RepID=A0A2B4S7D6_STYPI|nr:hypothetical protein AWC38_SpisGene10053 [Stylophora pistillata]
MGSNTSSSQPIYDDGDVSNISTNIEPSRQASLYEKRGKVKIGFCEIPLFWANLFFAFLAVTGQVGQKVSLPLWIDSVNGNDSGKSVDSYFVLSFSSLSFVIIFGLGTLFIKIFTPQDLGETEKRFPHLLLFLVGFCNALNGALVVFASKGSRTPPYLQAILGNFMIPLTVLFRRWIPVPSKKTPNVFLINRMEKFIMLSINLSCHVRARLMMLIVRKKPTLLKLSCSIIMVVGLFICLISTIFPEVDPESKERKDVAQGVSRVMWPIIFMLGFAPLAAMNVIQEKGVKMENKSSKKGINLLYFLFWTSSYQLLCVGVLFWLDVLPWYGNVSNIQEFGENWWFGVQCFFGGAGCDFTSGTRGTLFILMYVLSYAGGANLLRHTEGATWLAIVMSLVTPLGFIFWTLFEESPFKWHPAGHVSTWFSIGALAIMVPAIFVYNMGAPEISLDTNENQSEEYNSGQPLLSNTESRQSPSYNALKT